MKSSLSNLFRLDDEVLDYIAAVLDDDDSPEVERLTTAEALVFSSMGATDFDILEGDLSKFTTNQLYNLHLLLIGLRDCIRKNTKVSDRSVQPEIPAQRIRQLGNGYSFSSFPSSARWDSISEVSCA